MFDTHPVKTKTPCCQRAARFKLEEGMTAATRTCSSCGVRYDVVLTALPNMFAGRTYKVRIEWNRLGGRGEQTHQTVTV